MLDIVSYPVSSQHVLLHRGTIHPSWNALSWYWFLALSFHFKSLYHDHLISSKPSHCMATSYSSIFLLPSPQLPVITHFYLLKCIYSLHLYTGFICLGFVLFLFWWVFVVVICFWFFVYFKEILYHCPRTEIPQSQDCLGFPWPLLYFPYFCLLLPQVPLVPNTFCSLSFCYTTS